MVLQTTVDNLRARPRHERRAVARGIAMAVVAILFVGWVILFFRNIQANGIRIEPINIPTNGTFDTAPLAEAQNQIANSFSGLKENLKAVQNSAASQSQSTQGETQSSY